MVTKDKKMISIDSVEIEQVLVIYCGNDFEIIKSHCNVASEVSKFIVNLEDFNKLCKLNLVDKKILSIRGITDTTTIIAQR